MHIVFLFVGVLIQVSFLYFYQPGLAYELPRIVILSNSTTPPANQFIPIPFYGGSWNTTYIVYLLYFLVTIGYCVFVATITPSKRIVSPLHIQILTSIISSIIVGAYWAWGVWSQYGNSPSVISNFYQNYFAFAGVGIIIAFVFGATQTTIVMQLMGLSTRNEPERLSYVANASLQDVVSVLESKGFTSIWDTRLVREPGDTYFMRVHYRTGETTIVAIGKYPPYPVNTIFATVSYQTSTYELFRSPQASEQRESVMNDIEGRLRKKVGKEFGFSPIPVENPVSTRAMSIAMHPTKTSFSEVSQLVRLVPRYHLFATGLLIALMGAVVAIHDLIPSFSLGDYILAELGLFAAVVVDIGFAINAELKASSGTRQKEN